MDVEYDRRFLKAYDKAEPKIREAFHRRRDLFRKDPYHPALRNHALQGEYRGYRSINVTGDWRALYRQTGDKIIFIFFGTHSQLYK